MILNKIKEALEGTGLTGYYITRRNNTLPCVVYSFTSLPKSKADNVIDTIEYTVLCNILVVEDIENSKKIVMDSFLKHGFICKEIRATEFIELGSFFYTPIIFKIILKSEV